MVFPILSPPQTAMSGTSIAQRPDQPDIGQSTGAAGPIIMRDAVKPIDAARIMQQDPWPQLPPDPAPLKGLGIPPLNTKQVGDFDRLDAPTLPVPRYDAAPTAPMAARLDLLA